MENEKKIDFVKDKKVMILGAYYSSKKDNGGLSICDLSDVSDNDNIIGCPFSKMIFKKGKYAIDFVNENNFEVGSIVDLKLSYSIMGEKLVIVDFDLVD